MAVSSVSETHVSSESDVDTECNASYSECFDVISVCRSSSCMHKDITITQSDNIRTSLRDVQFRSNYSVPIDVQFNSNYSYNSDTFVTRSGSSKFLHSRDNTTTHSRSALKFSRHFSGSQKFNKCSERDASVSYSDTFNTSLSGSFSESDVWEDDVSVGNSTIVRSSFESDDETETRLSDKIKEYSSPTELTSAFETDKPPLLELENESKTRDFEKQLGSDVWPNYLSKKLALLRSNQQRQSTEVPRHPHPKHADRDDGDRSYLRPDDGDSEQFFKEFCLKSINKMKQNPGDFPRHSKSKLGRLNDKDAVAEHGINNSIVQKLRTELMALVDFHESDRCIHCRQKFSDLTEETFLKNKKARLNENLTNIQLDHYLSTSMEALYAFREIAAGVRDGKLQILESGRCVE